MAVYSVYMDIKHRYGRNMTVCNVYMGIKHWYARNMVVYIYFFTYSKYTIKQERKRN